MPQMIARAGLVIVALLALAFQASGAREVGTLGPYTVSFDMNTTAAYSVEVEPVSFGQTEGGAHFSRYNLSVRDGQSFLWLVLTAYNGTMLANTDANSVIVQNALEASSCDAPRYYEVAIDGHRGVVGTCSFPSGTVFVAASYSPDAATEGEEVLGRLNCRVISNYPWEVSRDMLNSLHIDVPGGLPEAMPGAMARGAMPGAMPEAMPDWTEIVIDADFIGIGSGYVIYDPRTGETKQEVSHISRMSVGNFSLDEQLSLILIGIWPDAAAYAAHRAA